MVEEHLGPVGVPQAEAEEGHQSRPLEGAARQIDLGEVMPYRRVGEVIPYPCQEGCQVADPSLL